MTQPLRVLAPNAGPMTLDGTNTWVLLDRGPAVVVDPGPADEAHLDAVLGACPDGVGLVLLTHHHADHTDAVPGLVARTGAPVRAVRPSLCSAAPLTDGERLQLPGGVLQVLHVPGHTSDSAAFLLSTPDGRWLLTGDTVLGRGTTVIAHPDGDLTDYLGSLQRLRRVVEEERVAELLPGHGPVRGRPAEVLEEYLRHREERLEQVRAARAAGALTPEEVVAAVYGDLEPTLAGAALRSVRAQLDHLDREAAG
ncbi:MBL fold metallo-hydrolase [Auraticoccus sp. F435]|uniref:MBL fold metallo-hydrolase n=1 Tax=Auraticoccus cholistanensis TaxID=2656650 RepID=A0A6A9UYJ2_9ACTN|nr:MBL fold metallo-hydrolase [Auraticoccus cholistanensis]MVA76922.1 MBL fold metallo-hydrolase [Auraticoccus cholistanensis]